MPIVRIPTPFPVKPKEEQKLANRDKLEAARKENSEENKSMLGCPYNELHPDGSIATCKLLFGHTGNHELVETVAVGATGTGQVTYSFTFRVGPGTIGL